MARVRGGDRVHVFESLSDLQVMQVTKCISEYDIAVSATCTVCCGGQCASCRDAELAMTCCGGGW